MNSDMSCYCLVHVRSFWLVANDNCDFVLIPDCDTFRVDFFLAHFGNQYSTSTRWCVQPLPLEKRNGKRKDHEGSIESVRIQDAVHAPQSSRNASAEESERTIDSAEQSLIRRETALNRMRGKQELIIITRDAIFRRAHARRRHMNSTRCIFNWMTCFDFMTSSTTWF